MTIVAGTERRRPKRTEDVQFLLQSHSLFRGLSATVLKELSAYLKRRSVARGTIIFSKGDPGSGMMGVIAGAVKITVTSEGGRDIVLNLIREGEIFGEIALLDGHARTADAIAMTDCELLLLERRDFIPFLRNNPDVTLELINILCARLRRTSQQVQDISFLHLPIRLARALLQLASKPTSDDRTRKLAITQKEISEIVGQSRESVNRQLRAWEKLGWIRLGKGGIALLKQQNLIEIANRGDLDVA